MPGTRLSAAAAAFGPQHALHGRGQRLPGLGAGRPGCVPAAAHGRRRTLASYDPAAGARGAAPPGMLTQ